MPEDNIKSLLLCQNSLISRMGRVDFSRGGRMCAQVTLPGSHSKTESISHIAGNMGKMQKFL